MSQEKFRSIIPPKEELDKKVSKTPEIKPIPSKEEPIIETEEIVSFMGVEVKKGDGGLRTPNKELLKGDTLTEFDFKMMRDLAVGMSLGQPTLIESGSGIGKSRTVERMCSVLNKEMYYANCHDMDVDLLIGKMSVSDDSESKTGFAWRDGVVIDAIRNGGVLFLDEYNFMKGETRAGLHFILDAVFSGKDQITLMDNHGEIIPVHPDLVIVAAQNPPGDKHTDREVLDPAQYTRFNFLKYPEDLPEETKVARALGALGIDNEINFSDEEFLLEGGISKEALGEVPGIREIIEKYLEFTKTITKLVFNGELAGDQPQKPHFAFQRDHSRIMAFVQKFYRGDINETFRLALIYYFVNKFESKEDRQKILLNLKEVRVDIKPDSRRTNLSSVKKKRSSQKESVEVTDEFSVFESKIKDLFSEFKEDGDYTPEQYLTDIHPFLLETYKKWSYNEEQLQTVSEVTSNPDNIHIGEDIPYNDFKNQNADESTREKNKKRTGEIYLSNESLDFENAKPFIPDLSSFNGKPLSEVLEHIHDTYNETYIIPDIKYYQYLIELGDKHKSETDPKKKEELLKQIPEQLRDGNWYFFPKSAFVYESGSWLCPRSDWGGGEFSRNAGRLDGGWASYYRVVLLER